MKGELTTQHLVMIIILIISFGIVLFLLFRLGLGEETQKEICHNSVVMVGKGKGLVGSLDCKTNYICISKGKKCEEFNPTKTVKVKTQEEIVEAIQKEIDDCWWMFGEGKIDYAGVFEGYVCAVCSVIKFDKTIQDKYTEIIFGEQSILTDEKYSVVTGMDDRAPLEDDYIDATIIKSDEIDSLGCDEFITKA